MLASALIGHVRVHLVEPTPFYWTDAELLVHLNLGVKDLWRAISDNFQDYFFAVNEGVSLEAGDLTLTNVPANVAKVIGIEPLTGGEQALVFVPRSYTHHDMAIARLGGGSDPQGVSTIYYAMTGAGAPVGAPTIHVAPRLSARLGLRLVYLPTVPALTLTPTDSPNPVPGESDDALICWTVAHGLAREREDRRPDPDWLVKYGNEKTNILTFLTPRQNDEPDVVEGLFEPWTAG